MFSKFIANVKDMCFHQHASSWCFLNNYVKRKSNKFLLWCITVVPGILSVKPDHDFDSTQKDYSFSKFGLNTDSRPSYGSMLLFPLGTAKHWLIRMERPATGVISKAQVVDYYVQVLMRVLRK